MEKNNDTPGKLSLDLNAEVARGSYSNLAIISHSHSEFVIDFATLLPGIPKPDITNRIIMAPEHAKRLMLAIQENVAKYEKVFGAIGTDGRGEEPFGMEAFGPLGKGGKLS